MCDKTFLCRDVRLEIRTTGAGDLITATVKVAGEAIFVLGTLSRHVADAHPEVWQMWKAFMKEAFDAILRHVARESGLPGHVGLQEVRPDAYPFSEN